MRVKKLQPMKETGDTVTTECMYIDIVVMRLLGTLSCRGFPVGGSSPSEN